MKKLVFATIISTLSFGAFAEDIPTTPAPNDMQNAEMPREHRHHNNFMANLTDEQKVCIKEFGCKMPERPEKAPKE